MNEEITITLSADAAEEARLVLAREALRARDSTRYFEALLRQKVPDPKAPYNAVFHRARAELLESVCEKLRGRP